MRQRFFWPSATGFAKSRIIGCWRGTEPGQVSRFWADMRPLSKRVRACLAAEQARRFAVLLYGESFSVENPPPPSPSMGADAPIGPWLPRPGAALDNAVDRDPGLGGAEIGGFSGPVNHQPGGVGCAFHELRRLFAVRDAEPAADCEFGIWRAVHTRVLFPD